MTTVRGYANFASMQADATPVSGDLALVAGYTTPGDGGGGTLYFTTPVPAGRTITGATNPANQAIVVTTAGAHGFIAGQRVAISGVAGNTAANGVWIVNSPTATTFALFKPDGTKSAGNAAYTSGGVIGDGGAIFPNVSKTGVWTRVL